MDEILDRIIPLCAGEYVARVAISIHHLDTLKCSPVRCPQNPITAEIRQITLHYLFAKTLALVLFIRPTKSESLSRNSDLQLKLDSGHGQWQ